MPGHPIAKYPFGYASAKLQAGLLFGPIVPQFQSAVLPQLDFIKGRRDRISFGLRELFLAPFSRPSAEPRHFLNDFTS
jgi:hypothetical protein